MLFVIIIFIQTWLLSVCEEKLMEQSSVYYQSVCNINMDISTFVIKLLQTKSEFSCAGQCNLNTECKSYGYKFGECYLLNIKGENNCSSLGLGNTIYKTKMQSDYVYHNCYVLKKGNTCHFKDCSEIYKSGLNITGVYQITPNNAGSCVDVYCDMDTAGGGWTVIQRRINGNVDFAQNWTTYKQGFGDKCSEYWMGNDLISGITSNERYILRVDLTRFSLEYKWAQYDDFKVSAESDQYRLTLGSLYPGSTAPDTVDGLSAHAGRQFSTIDVDNDVHAPASCAQSYGQGGWWFTACSSANLNAQYKHTEESSVTSMYWYQWTTYGSLKSCEMKIRPYNY